MSVHQVLTGALNDGEFTFSVGCVDGHKFIACAVGTNVVVHTPTFARIQILHGTPSSTVQAVNCCSDTGKIAFSQDNHVRIFEPALVVGAKTFPYRWNEAHTIDAPSHVDYLEWVLEGLRLLVLSDCNLALYQHCLLSSAVSNKDDRRPVVFNLHDDQRPVVSEVHWETVWATILSSPPKYVRFSPDCTLFATCGKEDRFVKIWFPIESSVKHGSYDFSFIYLQHPAIVYGFEWRRTGKYVPHKCVSNAIITWCADNTSRIWKQTPNVNDTVEQLLNAVQAVQQNHNMSKKPLTKNAKMKKARSRLISKISRLMKDKPTSPLHARGKSINFGRSSTFADFAIPVASANVSFSLSGTINSANDSKLVSAPGGIDAPANCGFAVHWLNNKEFAFTAEAEKLLADTLLSEHSEQTARSTTTSIDMNSPPDAESVDGVTMASGILDAVTPSSESHGHGLTLPQGAETVKDYFDHKIEGLLRYWHKTSDVLFSVHPVDGSLLIWTVEWLDDEWRQAVISFATCFVHALPFTDATSLRLALHVFSPHDAPAVDSHRFLGEHTEHEANQANNVIHLLTKHKNGSLNLWRLCMEENRQFSKIQNIVHRYRMCGHRFKTTAVAGHPTLPLLLSASSFVGSNGDDDASELILWQITPVGPLCKSGGVRELSRMTSKTSNAFNSISWTPAIIPSSAFGNICNSPSSCFVAYNEGQLTVYQAIVDARNFLNRVLSSANVDNGAESCYGGVSEEENDEVDYVSHDGNATTVKLSSLYNICSTQSTARPGCVLQLGVIENTEIGNDEILLLHTFDEALALSDSTGAELSKTSAAIGRFFLLLVQRAADGTCRMRMWSMQIATRAFSASQDETMMEGSPYYPTATPLAPDAARVYTTTTCVYDAPIKFDDEVQVESVTIAAGHQSSASLYPTCRTPYLLLLACDDHSVRFMRCVRSTSSSPLFNQQYVWEAWRMIGHEDTSELSIRGKICALASAHSGRFACAYLPRALPQELTAELVASSVNVTVYECESSGGVEWLQEEHLKLSRCFSNKNSLHTLIYESQARALANTNMLAATSSGQIEPSREERRSQLVSSIRIDWASSEDGAHLLTVGVANLVLFFAQMSQSTAQQNVTLMAEEQQSRKPTLRRDSSIAASLEKPKSSLVRWVCVRYVALDSVDSLAPLPTMLSWVRDGLLVIGMPSEMRVYSQWSLKSTSEAPKLHDAATTTTGAHSSTSRPSATLVQKAVKVLGVRPVASASNLSISNSQCMLNMLDQAQKSAVSKGTTPVDVREHFNETFALAANEAAKESELLNVTVDEGIFEASRLASPILPQYHPQQLIKMLNAGKTKRVKAILLHVLRCLRQHHGTTRNPLSRAASVRKYNASMDDDATHDDSGGSKNANDNKQRTSGDGDDAEFQELDAIPPLPLYVLLEIDSASGGNEKAANIETANEVYESLFDEGDSNGELDELLQRSDSHSRSSRSRHSSTASDSQHLVPNVFGSRHNQALTELLTHIHLPGLSSVDQMHLLAVSNTLSHFSSNVIDKLVQANAPLQADRVASLADPTASGYASTSGAMMETVDECGLRFLMAMKQHEYLLRYLPHAQKQRLRARGMSTSQIIWAFHSDAETELLNALPCCQKGKETWEELRAYGVAWWVRNTTTLRLCVEKVAKTAFQANQEPMDAALFYLALRKKNVLTHLFKTVGDSRMHDFFRDDFSGERAKKTALKNAFVLMSKQRFQTAAAFFLLGNSLSDAIQIILTRMKDLQLAMVIVRVYESDYDKQMALMEDLLGKRIFGLTSSELHEVAARDQDAAFSLSPASSRDPFERSMALWACKEFSMAAATLVEEAVREDTGTIPATGSEQSLPDIFSFYAFLRRNPLVMRQRLTNAGIQLASTEQFLEYARHLESRVTPNERRLYFRTASAHLTSGCPLLALDVLTMLPHNLCTTVDGVLAVKPAARAGEVNKDNGAEKHLKQDVDWSEPTNVVKDDELKLDWSDDEGDDDETASDKDDDKKQPTAAKPGPPLAKQELASANVDEVEIGSTDKSKSLDFVSQHIKFVAALKMMTDELSTLASGSEVEGGELRVELFAWLERECETLKSICGYQAGPSNAIGEAQEPASIEGVVEDLHTQRRRWLIANQKLLRTFTSYCILHSAQNHRLISVLMELILLLLEVQLEVNDAGDQEIDHVTRNSFPLFVASLSSTRMFVSSPLHFIEDQCSDLLLTILKIQQPPPHATSLSLVRKVYNLCQGLSSCLYQSLSTPENVGRGGKEVGGARMRAAAAASAEGPSAKSEPSKWPGLEALERLAASRDDDTPRLRLLLVKVFFSVSVSLFCYALAMFDARWLYRLCAREIDAAAFGHIFGGAGTRTIRPQRNAPPNRPPPPSSRTLKPTERSAETLRSNLHAKVFGPDEAQKRHANEQKVTCWVPPRMHLIDFYAEKVAPDKIAANEVLIDSDDCDSEASDEDEIYDVEARPHRDPTGFAWTLLRAACIAKQIDNLKHFLVVAGFKPSDLVGVSAHIDSVLKLLHGWFAQLQSHLDALTDGPISFLPSMYVTADESAFGDANKTANISPLLRKYYSLVERNNTPFEYSSNGVLPVKRLWAYLVRQHSLQPFFIHHIFVRDSTTDAKENIGSAGTKSSSSHSTNEPLAEAVRIVQKEREGIVSFACDNTRHSWIVLSTNREVQEIDLDRVLETRDNSKLLRSSSNFINNRVELDIAIDQLPKDKLRDNDDYQLLNNNGRAKTSGSAFLQKRNISGVRRLEAHPTHPYYVSGGADGSVILWEWNIDQPLFIARSAGQYAKVTKLAFAANGNKFASVDGDGHLCIWQAAQQTTTRKPFFNQKCHSKSAADVKFLGQTSSVLVTAGHSTNEGNIALWDVLLPQKRSLVYTFSGHVDGATCVAYFPGTQTIVSGGRHGEMCVWDLRQRQLLSTVKAYESAATVRCMYANYASNTLITGSSEGDIKIWNTDPTPQLLHSLVGEHLVRGGFSLRQVGSSSQHGVQQVYCDSSARLFSCGADCSLKIRRLQHL